MGQDLAQEQLGPVVPGIVEELVGFVPFDDLAFVHEDHPVGDRLGEAHLVGDDEHGHAGFGELDHHVRRTYASFSYRAKSWDKARRVVAKVEWHPGELFPRVGLDPLRGSSVTNLSRPAERVVAFYNQRGTAEQHIKEGKNAIDWTRVRRAYARPLDGRSRLTLP